MTTTQKEEPKPYELPDIVIDPGTNKRYIKGRFLGKVCLARPALKFKFRITRP